jgi:hypothetical protein
MSNSHRMCRQGACRNWITCSALIVPEYSWRQNLQNVTPATADRVFQFKQCGRIGV